MECAAVVFMVNSTEQMLNREGEESIIGGFDEPP